MALEIVVENGHAVAEGFREAAERLYVVSKHDAETLAGEFNEALEELQRR